MGQKLMCLTPVKICFVPWISFAFPAGALSRTHYNIERKPRKPTDYPSIWLLWWMPTEVWKCQCLEILYRSIWLSSTYSFSRWTGRVCAYTVGGAEIKVRKDFLLVT